MKLFRPPLETWIVTEKIHSEKSGSGSFSIYHREDFDLEKDAPKCVNPRRIESNVFAYAPQFGRSRRAVKKKVQEIAAQMNKSGQQKELEKFALELLSIVLKLLNPSLIKKEDPKNAIEILEGSGDFNDHVIKVLEALAITCGVSDPREILDNTED